MAGWLAGFGLCRLDKFVYVKKLHSESLFFVFSCKLAMARKLLSSLLSISISVGAALFACVHRASRFAVLLIKFQVLDLFFFHIHRIVSAAS